MVGGKEKNRPLKHRKFAESSGAEDSVTPTFWSSRRNLLSADSAMKGTHSDGPIANIEKSLAQVMISIAFPPQNDLWERPDHNVRLP